MYYKINKTGCNERKGLVQIRFDCYLDTSDFSYADHHVTVPDITGSYTGKVDATGMPVDQKDYDAWVASFPTVIRDNPFCCHFRCFEPDVTDEEILKAGDEILTMAYANHQKNDLRANKNTSVTYTTNIVKIQASLSRIETIKQTDFAAAKEVKG